LLDSLIVDVNHPTPLLLIFHHPMGASLDSDTLLSLQHPLEEQQLEDLSRRPLSPLLLSGIKEGLEMSVYAKSHLFLAREDERREGCSVWDGENWLRLAA
jgi:hypothetical protein